MGAVNGCATLSAPSTILSGSAGNAHGAGPSTTLAPSFGSNNAEWQSHDRSPRSARKSVRSQPACKQSALYATTPSADNNRVAGLKVCASNRIRSMRFRRDPLRTIFLSGSAAQATIGKLWRRPVRTQRKFETQRRGFQRTEDYFAPVRKLRISQRAGSRTTHDFGRQARAGSSSTSSGSPFANPSLGSLFTSCHRTEVQ